jgi:hypothetical protein
MVTQVCKEDDPFVRDSMRWVVRLSNDEVVYEDDGRPGVEPASAWIRLGQYCREANLRVVQMWLQFRSSRIEVTPADAPGYYLAKSVFAVWGDGRSYESYVVGTLREDGLVATTRWRTPELVPMEQGIREADPRGPFLIAANG